MCQDIYYSRFGDRSILKVEDATIFCFITYNAFGGCEKIKPTKNIGIKVELGQVRLDWT